MQERPKRSDTVSTLPMVPLRDIVVFPHTMVPFVVGRRGSLLAVEQALGGDKQIFLSTQRNAKVDNPNSDEINSIGTVATIVQHLKLPNGNVKLLVEGTARARILEIDEDPDGFFRVVLKPIERPAEMTPELQERMTKISALFERFIKYSPGLPYETMLSTVKIADPGRLTDTIAAHLPVVDRREAGALGDGARPGPLGRGRAPARGRDRKAEGRQEDQQPRQEADGEGAKRVLPQREDQGDPAGARTQGRAGQRDRGVPAEDRSREDAGRSEGKGPPRAEAARGDAAGVRGSDGLAELPRMAARGAVVEEVTRADRHQARRAHPRRGPLRPRQDQGAHPRVPRGAPARQEDEGLHPLLRRSARRRQDLARALDRARHGARVRPPLPGGRAGRGGDPRPPADVHRRVSRVRSSR